MAMSSPKRVCTSHDGTTPSVEPPAPAPRIPVDVLLEIVARVDVATVVRFAATSKAVRRAILGDPTLGRRVGGAHLLGVSYAISQRNILSFVGQAPRQTDLGFDAGRKLMRCSEPVASRGGLVVLLDRRSYPCWLFVCNAVTQRTQWVQLPTSKVQGATTALLAVALLTVGGDAAGRSFQLLVVTSNWLRPASLSSLRTQIYSKDDDGRSGWGSVTEITDLPPELERKLTRHAPSRRPKALVLGGGTAVHWLHNNDSGRCIVRLDIGEANKATLIALPPECVHRAVDDGELQLAASTTDRKQLSLVVAGRRVISMWTLSSPAAAAPAGEEGGSAAARWTRQVVIRREAIAAGVPAGRCKEHRDIFLGFGELSGTVVLLMHRVGLVRINLRTKEALVLGRSDDDEFKEIEAARDGSKKIEACLHEIDLPSILLAMKPY